MLFPTVQFMDLSPEQQLVSWSLMSLFSTNMAISETNPEQQITNDVTVHWCSISLQLLNLLHILCNMCM